jgi:hypothetical protein
MKLSPRRQRHLKYIVHGAVMAVIWCIPLVGAVVVIAGILIGDPAVFSPFIGIYHLISLFKPDSEVDRQEKEQGKKCKSGMPYWDM